MALIYDGAPHRMCSVSKQCLACQLVDGKIKCGICLCDSCFNRLLVVPYGRVPDISNKISALSLKVPNPPLKYNELIVFYRFKEWDTLISARQGTRSFSLLTLQGIKPMTSSFLEEVASKIDLWVLLS